MFQDSDSYDGQTFYLPNKGEMLISDDKIKTYFYPYSKTSENKTKIKGNTIYFNIRGNSTPTEFHFQNDTLILSMYFIDKIFIKMFERIPMDENIIEDLDAYGFRPASLKHRFELDTFRNNMKMGFPSYDSLKFQPFKHIQFVGNNKIRINDSDPVSMKRSYNGLNFKYRGDKYYFRIVQAQGTQTVTMVPLSQCECDSIIIPYMTVDWANRIRQAIVDYKDFQWRVESQEPRVKS